jgi:cytosine/adenosine deaminase-related metal-dependent hydrolase
LEPGKCADFIAYDLQRLEFAGALHDPLAALVFCQSVNVDWSFVQGKAVVRQGQLVGLDLPRHIEAHNRAARRLVEG